MDEINTEIRKLTLDFVVFIPHERVWEELFIEMTNLEVTADAGWRP